MLNNSIVVEVYVDADYVLHIQGYSMHNTKTTITKVTKAEFLTHNQHPHVLTLQLVQSGNNFPVCTAEHP